MEDRKYADYELHIQSALDFSRKYADYELHTYPVLEILYALSRLFSMYHITLWYFHLMNGISFMSTIFWSRNNGNIYQQTFIPFQLNRWHQTGCFLFVFVFFNGCCVCCVIHTNAPTIYLFFWILFFEAPAASSATSDWNKFIHFTSLLIWQKGYFIAMQFCHHHCIVWLFLPARFIQ